MSFSALQGATLISAHCGLTKLIISFTYRTYNFFGPKFLGIEKEQIDKFNENFHVKEFQKAIANESEFAAFLAGPLFYLALAGVEASQGATLAVLGQVSYVWTRTALGYPCIPTIATAILRYAGMALTFVELWKVAFPAKSIK
ncbi:unnamed protein product [Cylindrotheca closterium]|uniref:Uncharacterized protein n=1 Tax=Cylindrotheca closterium TaxID=2856 RepID=A0AAD2JH29_9STRA|nr:unnamed protein product [Cylindrotheca closterium]